MVKTGLLRWRRGPGPGPGRAARRGRGVGVAEDDPDGRWTFHERRALQLPAAPLADLPDILVITLRRQWPGTEPAPADLLEGLPTRQAYAASRGSAG